MTYFVLFNFFESIFEVHDKLMVLRVFMYALFRPLLNINIL